MHTTFSGVSAALDHLCPRMDHLRPLAWLAGTMFVGGRPAARFLCVAANHGETGIQLCPKSRIPGLPAPPWGTCSWRILSQAKRMVKRSETE